MNKGALMKMLFLFCMLLISFTACSKESEGKKEDLKKDEKKKEASELSPAPCDKKEDLLKKLEAEKKAQEEKGKGFSLQGAKTGCSVK
jgi:hypothetical protein